MISCSTKIFINFKYGKIVKIFSLLKYVGFFNGKLKFHGVALSLILTFQNISDSSPDRYSFMVCLYSCHMGSLFSLHIVKSLCRGRILVLN